jgi:predicted aspartyl protease
MVSFSRVDFRIVLLAVLLTPAALAQESSAPSSDLFSARQLFRQGDFRSAAAAFQKVIDGKASGLFVLDSGANVNSVSPELGKRIPEMRMANTPVIGASGTVNGAQVADVNLRFAGVRRDVRIITVDLRPVSKDLGTEVSGQIGFNTLDRMKIAINYRDGLVEFQPARK